ncbi:M16 family metallopeptidase [Sphingorhabdus contaminans]|nr:pitrilysin family protein [Sphingorhabdus contaminans]
MIALYLTSSMALAASPAHAMMAGRLASSHFPGSERFHQEDRVEKLVSKADVRSARRAARDDAGVAKSSSDDPLANLELDVPATKFTLKNGLTLIVHEDRSAPLVAAHIWYHVGSKNEPKGKSGFAHLFEHLMFNGSENFNDDFFKATQKIGASNQNGTTWWDRTNYYQTVPKEALDSILWLESDRMGHLLGAIDQAKLDEQRAVVKNEKRQGDNRPYAKADDLIIRATTSQGHPYDHSTIGSMEDLDAASLDDVKQWFRDYYGPSNAVLVLAGDIDPQEALAKVEKYFGDIAPGTPVSQPKSWVEKRTGTVRETAYDRVSQARLYRVWNVSDYASADTDYLQFFGYILGSGKNSRLYKRLVVEEQLATSIEAGIDNREIGGQFQINATVKPGGNLARVETIVDQELNRLITEGPSREEMARVRTSVLAGFARSLESISSKAAQLAESQTYLDSPDGWKAGFNRFKSATAADLQKAAKTWLTDGDYVLHMLPFGNLTASATAADRSKMPEPGASTLASFPSIERATLANGLKLIVANRPGIPLVNMTMLVKSGPSADFASIVPGTGNLAVSLMDEGSKTRSGEKIAEDLASLGATLGTGGGGDTSTVSLSALKPALDKALDIYADVIRNPVFATKDVERVKAQFAANITATKQDPRGAAGRITPRLVHGAQSPYGNLINEADIAKLDAPQLRAFHDRWFKPNNAVLVIAGDTSLAEIRPQIEAAFKNWNAGDVPATIAPTTPKVAKSIVYLIDKPGAPQSVIRASQVAPVRLTGDEVARDAFNTAFGGSFTSRLNMKLREEKGWAYGAGSGVSGGKGSRLFSASASVQADKTAESMAEIAMLIKSATTDRKLDAAELASAKDNMGLGLSSDWSTGEGISSYLLDEAASDLPTDYYRGYPELISGLNLPQVQAAGQELLAGQPLIWVVAGDAARIEPKIRALNLGPIERIDPDGNPVR